MIAWSVGNEISEASGGSEKAVQTVQNLVNWSKEIDPTRPVTMGMDAFRFSSDGSGAHESVAQYLDLVGFNYAEKNYDATHQRHPEWVLYGSETSSATKSRGMYAHPDTEGSSDSNAHDNYQQYSYDNDRVAWGSTATDAWIWDRDREYIPGQFVWTGFDYIGEPTPWHNTGGAGHDLSPKSSFFGIVDTAGFPKDDYYLYQSVWKPLDDDNSNAMVHILPHWN